jgi:hypothetical protein
VSPAGRVRAVRLVAKLIALANSTPFAAERDAAIRKAAEVASREGIAAVAHAGRRYVFRPVRKRGR